MALCAKKLGSPRTGVYGTGTVELPGLLWTTHQGKLTATAQAKKIKMRCPEGARTLPGGWAPGPVRPAGGTASYRIATCAPEGGNATQVIMRSLDGGWEWEGLGSWESSQSESLSRRRSD